MKYLLLIYGNNQTWDWDKWSNDELDAANREMDKIIDDIRESGELIDGHGLANPARTKTIWLRDGIPVVTDGPYGEAKEVLAGYFLIDCESEDRNGTNRHAEILPECAADRHRNSEAAAVT